MHPYRDDGQRTPIAREAPALAHYSPISRGVHYLHQAARALPSALAFIYFVLAVAGVLEPRSPRLLAILVLCAGAQLLVVLVVRQGLLALSERQAMVSTLLEAGQVRAAVAACEALIFDARAHPAWHSVFVTDRAGLALVAGDVDLAGRLLEVIAQAGWFETLGQQRASAVLLGSRARVEIARGDLARAEEYAALARARMPAAVASDLAVLEALLDLRLGRAKAAVARLRESWPACLLHLRAPQRRALTLLRAYAIEESGGDLAEASALLETARPVAAWNIASLRLGWPAFEDFLARHGLPESYSGLGFSAASPLDNSTSCSDLRREVSGGRASRSPGGR